MSQDEKAALHAYVARQLELPGPPTFLVCTTPGLQRAAMMSFHHQIVEGVLIADVPARAWLDKNLSRHSLMHELVESNGKTEQAKVEMQQLTRDAQNIVFDGQHTPTFSFMFRRSAEKWAETDVKLRGCPITLRWADTGASTTTV